MDRLAKSQEKGMRGDGSQTSSLARGGVGHSQLRDTSLCQSQPHVPTKQRNRNQSEPRVQTAPSTCHPGGRRLLEIKEPYTSWRRNGMGENLALECPSSQCLIPSLTLRPTSQLRLSRSPSICLSIHRYIYILSFPPSSLLPSSPILLLTLPSPLLSPPRPSLLPFSLQRLCVCFAESTLCHQGSPFSGFF